MSSKDYPRTPRRVREEDSNLGEQVAKPACGTQNLRVTVRHTVDTSDGKSFLATRNFTRSTSSTWISKINLKLAL